MMTTGIYGLGIGMSTTIFTGVPAIGRRPVWPTSGGTGQVTTIGPSGVRGFASMSVLIVVILGGVHGDTQYYTTVPPAIHRQREELCFASGSRNDALGLTR